jgi:hypothetical protein
MLMRPVDEVVAYTEVGLHRSNFVDEDMPGVVEGTSHDLIADAMAAIGQAPSASLRGFRYGTHVPAGWPITMEDIYHYIPIAAKLGRTQKACGADLKFADADGIVKNPSPMTILNRTPAPWSTARGTNIKVGGVPIDDHQVYDGRALVNGVANPSYQKCVDMANNATDGYTVAGYWYAEASNTINNCNPCIGRQIQVVKTDGSIVQVAGPGAPTTLPNSLDVMDISEAVVKYLRENLHGTVTEANLPIHRLTVKRLPTISPPGYDFPMIQPLKGASTATCPTL